MSRPDLFSLQLIQASTFNTTKRGQIAANILQAVGRFDVPIGIGRYTGEQNVPQYAFAADYTLDDFAADGGTVYQGTAQMASIMATATPADPVFIIEIAPATSLGDVLSANPSLAANCITVAMSGSVYRGYGNASVPSAEYNVREDIRANQWMYNATWLQPLTTAPLDTTIFDQFYGPTYSMLLAANDSSHLHAQTLLTNYVAWYNGGGKSYYAILPFSPSTGTSTLYDLQAAWMTGYIAASYGYGPYASASASDARREGAGSTGGVDNIRRDAAAGAVAPTVPYTILQLNPMAVNGTGYTNIVPSGSANGRPVYAATSFASPRSPYDDALAMGAEVIGAINAAA